MRFIFFVLIICRLHAAPTQLGVDTFFEEGCVTKFQGKRIGLITNQTGVDKHLVSTIDRLKGDKRLNLCAIFAPEHGLSGVKYAGEAVASGTLKGEIPIYSLHGETRRPTEAMLKNIDVLIYDIQDIGVRSYTYATTLFYCMEEAAKRNIEVVVLDRPNPMGGLLVDGPMLGDKNSFVGYLNTPYCHGLTIGELGLYFKDKRQKGCRLTVVPMRGWKRGMTFAQTGLAWVPTSPQIPESNTPFFCAATGILGEMGLVNIGVGYTLPFKVIGAPWIDADKLATMLNQHKLRGVRFLPFHYTPFFGKFHKQECHGVKIIVDHFHEARPMNVQFAILSALKSLYPKEFEAQLDQTVRANKTLFSKVMGSETLIHMILNEKVSGWKMIEAAQKERKEFETERSKYFLYSQ